MHPVERALVDPSDEAFENLKKGQAIYVILEMLDVETPDEHPDDYDGGISREQLQAMISRVHEIQGEESYLEDDDEE